MAIERYTERLAQFLITMACGRKFQQANYGGQTALPSIKYRFGYGRKWTLEKMKETVLKLPSQEDGTPDFLYMENYIKSLPYSDRI